MGTRPISVTTICTSPFWPEWCPTYRSRATRCSQDSTTSPLGGNVPFFHYKQQEFWTYYHQRSNVETVFSMIKEKFGQSLFSKSRAGQRGDLQGTVPQPRRGQSGAPLWAEPLAGRPAARCWLRAMHHHQPKGNGMQSREDTERPRSYNRGLQSWQQSTCPPQTNAEGRWCVISGSDEVMGSGDLCAESRAYVQAHFHVQGPLDHNHDDN